MGAIGQKHMGAIWQKHLVQFVKSMCAIWNATGAKWQAKHMGALSVMGPVLVTSIVSFLSGALGTSIGCSHCQKPCMSAMW